MSQPIRGQGGYLVFMISPKNVSLVEDVEILLPVKFCWILFKGFRRKVENVSVNHRPGRPFCFSDPPEKHKLGRGRWDLPIKFRQIPFTVSEEKSKMSQPIRGQGGNFVFSWFAWKTQKWWKALRACFLSSFAEFRSAVSEEKSKMSQPIRGQGGHFVFLISPKTQTW